LKPAISAENGTALIDYIYIVNSPSCLPEGGVCCSEACPLGVPSLDAGGLISMILALVAAGGAFLQRANRRRARYL